MEYLEHSTPIEDKYLMLEYIEYNCINFVNELQNMAHWDAISKHGINVINSIYPVSKRE